MARKLRIWNGRGHGRLLGNHHFYVAAYSVREAVQIINEHAKCHITSNEINEYYSQCWGNPMNGITPETPCLYAQLHNNVPFLIFKDQSFRYKTKPKS